MYFRSVEGELLLLRSRLRVAVAVVVVAGQPGPSLPEGRQAFIRSREKGQIMACLLVCLLWPGFIKTVLANAKADLAAPEPAMLITMLIRLEGVFVFESEGPGTLPEFLMP